MTHPPSVNWTPVRLAINITLIAIVVTDKNHKPQQSKNMLVLSRKVDQSIFIGDNIEVIVARIDRNVVRIAISAPKETLVFRGELLDEVNKLQDMVQIKRTKRSRF